MRRFIMSQELPTLDPLASFVDVGSEHMHVSVGGNKPEVFGTVTSQLHALRDWLLEQGVHSVAMEATGVYWLPLAPVWKCAWSMAGRRATCRAGRPTWLTASGAPRCICMAYCTPASCHRLIFAGCRTTYACAPVM